MSLLKKNYIPYSYIRSSARAGLVPSRQHKGFCNSGMPLNAHYQVFLSRYLTIFTQHTLKGNLYHKLSNMFLSVLWMKRLWLPSNADNKLVPRFLQVVQNHNSDFSNCSIGS